MVEKIGSIEQIPEQPEFPEKLVEETGITVHEVQPEPLPRGIDESSSWLVVLRERLAKIARGRKEGFKR